MTYFHSRRHVGLAFLILAALSQPHAMAAEPAAASVPESKLVSSFTPMAGSTENSTSLVEGLRSGTPIVLTSPPSTPGAPINTVTFTSPTRPMGYGNIKIALSLAKTQLASQGITQPTPEQLQGALMGSPTGTSTVTQQGILQMRASGMGWGQIANSMGVKLGTVMSGKTPATTTTTTTSGAVNASGAKSTASSSSGLTTAAGAQGKSQFKHSSTTTAEGTQSSVNSKGITTSQGHNGGAGGALHGAVNAAGSRAGGIGSAAGANAGHGNGKKP